MGRCLKLIVFLGAGWVGNLHTTPLPIKTDRRLDLRLSSSPCLRGLLPRFAGDPKRPRSRWRPEEALAHNPSPTGGESTGPPDEAMDVVVVHCNKGVVGLPQPEEDDVTGTGGVVSSRVIGKGSFLKVFHE